MKKLLAIMLVLLTLCGCKGKDKPEFTYDIKSTNVDMSYYDGVGSTNHKFKEILPVELENVFANNSSGVFYLGYIDCPFCQKCIKYLDEVSREEDVTVYYLDAMNDYDPLKGERLRDIEKLLIDIMQYDKDTGDYNIWTPSVFNVINGKIVDYYVGLPTNALGETDWSNPPTDKQISKLVNGYRKVIKPFVK